MEEAKENDMSLTRPMAETRFWGHYVVLDYVRLADGQEELTKRLHISAGQAISYQKHLHRKEIWTIADGIGMFVCNGMCKKVVRGDVLIINKRDLHAIKAISELIVIEVQLGYPLVEDDIERFDYHWDG